MNASFSFCQALIERTAHVVFSYDITAGRFTYLNPAFEDIFVKAREGTTAAGLFLAVHPEDQHYVKDNCQELLHGIGKKNIEFRVQLPNEGERWINITPFLVEEKPGRQFVIGFADDITAAKKYSENLLKFNNKKNSILNILSHDLAGPLGNIHALAEMLADDLKPYENEDAQRVIGLIEQSSKHSINMIQDFVKQEFLESAAVDLIKRRMDLVKKIEQIITQYQQSEKNIQKVFRLSASSQKIYVEMDGTKFMQAINNLISNAIKFTPDGGIITIDLKEEAETVLISVADNGIGIPEKYHATLFDKFTKARRPGIKGEPSVGLGMSIIQTIVAWHNGKIWFESEVNKGTTFYISLPKTSTILPADA